MENPKSVRGNIRLVMETECNKWTIQSDIRQDWKSVNPGLNNKPSSQNLEEWEAINQTCVKWAWCGCLLLTFTTRAKGKGFSNSITPQHNNHIKTRHESSTWQVITQSLTSVRPSQTCWLSHSNPKSQLPPSLLTSDPGLWFKPLLLSQFPYF